MKLSLESLTAGLTNSVASKAKDSAISTLKDPEFKATVNKFTSDWFKEHEHIIIPIVLSFVIFSILALSNILSNFHARKSK